MQSITDKPNNKFYQKSYETGIENERLFCQIFNNKFNQYGFSINQINGENKYSTFDAGIYHNSKLILATEIKTRADKFFKSGCFIYDTAPLNKSKIDNTLIPETLFIFGNQNFNHIYFYFNILRCKYLKYNQEYQRRADRPEKSLSYMIPLDHCFNNWNQLLKFLKLLILEKINKSFSAESIFDLLKFAPQDFFQNYSTENIPF